MYNNSVHQTIGMKRREVKRSNEGVVLKRIRKNTTRVPKGMNPAKFKLGDRVRVSKHKMTFAKVYTPNWTNEIFTVRSVQNNIPVTYLL